MEGMLVFVIVLSSHLLVEASIQTCCFPDHYEGRRFIFEKHEARHFAIDYKEKLLFTTYKPYGPYFNVTDFQGGITYAMTPAGCSTHVFSYSHIYPQCVETISSNQAPGVDKSGVEVENYFLIDHDYTVHGVVARRDGQCYPFMTRTTWADTSETGIFSFGKSGVHRDELLKHITECKQSLLMQ